MGTLCPATSAEDTIYIMSCERNISNELQGLDFKVERQNGSINNGNRSNMPYRTSHFYEINYFVLFLSGVWPLKQLANLVQKDKSSITKRIGDDIHMWYIYLSPDWVP